MKLRPIPVLLTFLFLIQGIILPSCKAIFEPDISKNQVTPEAPSNLYQSTSYAIGFWWDAMDDALQYHLQVVTPKFDTVGALVLDTIIKSNKFTININPGQYQWRVRAENGSSQTAYTTPRSFTVLQSSVTKQKVQLLSPANTTLTNQSSVLLQWSSMYGATKYQLEIDTNNFVNENVLIYNQLLPGQQFSFTFPKDQVYQWRVKAQNDTAQAQWSAINQITYDHTPPAIVTLTAPGNNQTLSLPAALQWNTVATATKYKLYVLQSDSATLYNNTFPMTLTTSSYSFNLGKTGDKIYWKVTAVDAAGNEGTPSLLRHFVLQ